MRKKRLADRDRTPEKPSGLDDAKEAMEHEWQDAVIECDVKADLAVSGLKPGPATFLGEIDDNGDIKFSGVSTQNIEKCQAQVVGTSDRYRPLKKSPANLLCNIHKLNYVIGGANTAQITVSENGIEVVLSKHEVSPASSLLLNHFWRSVKVDDFPATLNFEASS